MPRFYLNIFDGCTTIDREGIDLADLAEAAAVAARGARELIAEEILAGRPIYQGHRVEVSGPTGILLSVIRFGDLISLI